MCQCYAVLHVAQRVETNVKGQSRSASVTGGAQLPWHGDPNFILGCEPSHALNIGVRSMNTSCWQHCHAIAAEQVDDLDTSVQQ